VIGVGKLRRDQTFSDIKSSSHPYITVYVFVLIVYTNQETLLDNSVYKIIGRIVISRVTNYQNTRCLLFI